MTRLIVLFEIGFVLVMLQCVENNPAANIDTEHTHTLSGLLRYSDGKPASGITVYLREKNVVASIPGDSQEKTGIESISAVTSSSGSFKFDSKPIAGMYVAEAKHNGSSVLIDSVIIESNVQNVILEPAVLEPTGAILGNAGPVTGTMYLLVFGLDRYTKVNNDGTFSLSDLPSGNYRLRFLTTGENANGFRDTADIKVVSEETTLVNISIEQNREIPIPRDLTINYDTLRQTATLSWEMTDTSGVRGYSVYRRNVDSNAVFTIPINPEPVTSTTYMDSYGLQGFTYEYRIAAVGLSGGIGAKCIGVQTHFSTYLKCDTVVSYLYDVVTGTFIRIGEGFMSEKDEIYVGANIGVVENPHYQVFDTTLHLLRHFPIGTLTAPEDWPKQVAGSYMSTQCAGAGGYIYIRNAVDLMGGSSRTMIHRRNETGTCELLSTFPYFAAINVFGPNIYCFHDSTIDRYSNQSILESSKQFSGIKSIDKIIIADPNCFVLVDLDIQTRITVCDSSGQKQGEMVLPPNLRVWDLAYDKQQQFVYVTTKRGLGAILYIFSMSGIELANYKIYNNSVFPSDITNVSVMVSKTGSCFLLVQGDWQDQRFIKLQPLSRKSNN